MIPGITIWGGAVRYIPEAACPDKAPGFLYPPVADGQTVQPGYGIAVRFPEQPESVTGI